MFSIVEYGSLVLKFVRKIPTLELVFYFQSFKVFSSGHLRRLANLQEALLFAALHSLIFYILISFPCIFLCNICLLILFSNLSHICCIQHKSEGISVLKEGRRNVSHFISFFHFISSSIPNLYNLSQCLCKEFLHLRNTPLLFLYPFPDSFHVFLHLEYPSSHPIIFLNYL